MTSRRSASRRFAGLLLTVAACTGGEPRGASDDAAYTLVDADGKTVALDGPASRVVSLVPSATATIHALGSDDVLVGRTDFDTASWAAPVPSVGGGLEPSLEAVVALSPDLVIRFAGEQDTRTPARLDELGIHHMAVRPDRLEDIYRTVALVGSFNDWTPGRTLFAREGNDWVCRVDLPAGKHAYKFVVDGRRIVDPSNAQAEDDGRGQVNSILVK